MNVYNKIDALKPVAASTKVVLAVAVVCIVIIAALNACCFSLTSMGAILASNLALFAFLYVLIRCLRIVCFKRSDQLATALLRFSVIVAVSIISGLALEICTLAGDPLCGIWDVNRWSIRRIAVFCCISFCLLSFLLERYSVLKSWFVRFVEVVRSNALIVVGGLVLFFSATIGATAFLCLKCRIMPFAALVFSASLVACVMILLITAKTKRGVEAMFCAVVVTVGLCFALICPPVVGLVWDDEIHYENVLKVSYLFEPTYTHADDLMILHGDYPESWLLTGDANDVERYTYILDEGNNVASVDRAGKASGAMPHYIFPSLQSIGYIPSAIGLWLGRLIHLPFGSIVAFGRLTSLLFYVVLCFFAIRIAPIKKTLLASLALLPTPIVLASNFTYDTWILAFAFLGTALLSKALCGRKKIRCSDLFPSLVAFSMAIIIKPVYFPLIGMFLLFRRGKFTDKRQWSYFAGGIVFTALLLAGSFIVPFVLFGAGGNDMRGGPEVNSDMQVSFILGNPIGYGITLAKFLVTSYLNPLSSSEYTLQFGYMGNLGANRLSFLSVLPLFVVIIVSLLDSDRLSISLCSWRNRLIAFFAFVLCVALVATSMYISITGVGSPTIKGVQGRYLLPLLPCLLVFFFNIRIMNEINKTVFNLLPICFLGSLGFLGCWLFVVSHLTV